MSARTQSALQRMWDLGIETVFVTARPPRWIDPLAEHVGGHGVAICANGAFVYDVEARRVVEAVGLPSGSLSGIVADVRAAYPGVGFAAERPEGMHLDPAYRSPMVDLHAHDDPPAARGPIESVRGVVGKLLARCPEVPDVEFVESVATIVADRGIVAYSGAGGLAEIGPPGVTKATALERWCRERSIDAAQVWAFGDMPNDLPMLAWAGRSFAMRSGHEEVRDLADAVCAGNDDDGVARVLEAIR
ncbi:putative hydrolase [Kineosphaera limosa NBRC 100340]|uniref:Putative hydrolase n=1 Tax=Kineosphaera limosa NBRC 100340 TaxID=1184609 RepID=K6VGX0_9MICO|nr:putative hydrolase [Kineosphaera limosa NBRC 100340]